MANTVWDGGNSSGVSLAGLVATCTVANGYVRAADGQINGKYYFEVTVNVDGGTGGNLCIGLCTGAAGSFAATGFNAALVYNSGAIYLNGSQYYNLFSLAALAAGTTVCVAGDLDNGFVWFRIGAAGLWMGQSWSLPSVPATGMNLRAMGVGPAFPWYPVVGLYRIGDQVTANFGDSTFVGAVPPGFNPGWLAGPGAGPNYAVITQALVEQWVVQTPPALMTQAALEQWVVQSPSALITQVAIEEWGPPPTFPGAAQMDGGSSVAATGLTITMGAPAAMDGSAQMLATSVLMSSGAANMDGQVEMSAAGTLWLMGAARMDGQAQMSAVTIAQAAGVARMDGQVQMSAASHSATTAGAAQMDGHASTVIAQSVHGAGLAEMFGEASMDVAGASRYTVAVSDTVNLTQASSYKSRFKQFLWEPVIRLGATPEPHSQFHYTLTSSVDVPQTLVPTWSALLNLVQNLEVHSTTVQKFIWGRVLTQALKVSAAVGAGGLYKFLLSQLFKLSEARGLSLKHPVALSEGVGLAWSLKGGISLKLLQKLAVAASASSAFTYHFALASRVLINSIIDRRASQILTQLFTVQPTISRQFIADSSLAQLLTVHPALNNKLLLEIVEVGNIQLHHDQLVEMIYRGDPLLDGVVINAIYISPSGTTTTWAVNTRTNAVTEYMNYDFRSFALMGNRYIAAGSDGLYELDGDTDDGALIISDLMSGYLQLNAKKLFGIKGVYVAIRGGGRFYLKLIAGDGRDYIYELKAQPNLMTTKIKVGKGIKTTYMAFELVTEGQDFDLDSLEFIPMASGRRV